MINAIKNTTLYNSLNLMQNIHHAYLFSSVDKELNNIVAKAFAKSLLCENLNACGVCFSCKQIDCNSHPDFTLIDQPSIKVEDVNNLTNKLNTLPIAGTKKVFVILNAENINEVAQNKLLKSLEEPNSSNIFILTSSKVYKLLPTVLSRLYKINVPKLLYEDKDLLAKNIKDINFYKYLNSDVSLTDIINFETNENYKKTINAIKYIFENLKSSQDIPKVAFSLPEFDKSIFFNLLQKLFISCLNNENIFSSELTTLIKLNYSNQVLINCLPLIEEAYKKHSSNVNFGYILDNLLFNILKEKFLCKQ